ncbi:hypothetical protein ACHAWF_002087 [Thalassiosira exigua]
MPLSPRTRKEKRGPISPTKGGGHPPNHRCKLGKRDETDFVTFDALPGSILSTVATYLAVPSRAFLAVALTAPSSSFVWGNVKETPTLSVASNSVLLPHSQWEVLNFSEVEMRPGCPMRDHDLRAVLLCVGARNQLKRLKLVNCNCIQGDGLEPLRGSVVLEQMDLSLVEQESEYDRGGKICLDTIVPILESIVSKEGCVLRHIDFPQKHSMVKNVERFNRFVDTYCNVIANRGNRCSKCNDVCNTIQVVRSIGRWRYQSNTCCKCTKHYCSKPTCFLEGCGRCGKHHCKDCTSLCDLCGKTDACTARCEDITTNCGSMFCADCVKTCQQCEKRGCHDCLDYHCCPGCGDNGFCGNCYETESVGGDQVCCEDCGFVDKSDY